MAKFSDVYSERIFAENVPCRLAPRRCRNLTDITRGRATMKTFASWNYCIDVKAGSLCGLGHVRTCLSTEYFRDEYEAYSEARGPARVCVSLIKFSQQRKLQDVRFVQGLPSDAITGEEQPAFIDKYKCIKRRSCILACRFAPIDPW